VAQASKSYEVKFVGNTTSLTKSFQTIQKSAGALGRDVSRSSNLMRAAIASVSVAGLAAGLRSATKAAAEDQKAQLKLAKTLENVTGATDSAIAATEQFITAQQFATGVSDTQLRPALETLVRATGDVTKAQELLKLGLDVSAGSGRDLESISLALAKAQGGQFTALQRLGIVIPETVKKSKDFAQVQEYLNKLFGGQAAVAAGTYEGKLAILGERMGEVKETLGGALIPILTGFADKIIKDVMPSIEVFVNALTGQTSIASSLSESQETAFRWGNNIRAIIQTIVNYKGEIIAFGAVMVGIFAVAKVVAAGTAIIKIVQGIIKVYQALQASAILAATAMAFGSGGLSVAAGAIGAAAAVAAIGVAMVATNAVINKYKSNVADLPKIEVAPDGVLQDTKVFKDVVIPTVDKVGKAGKAASKGVASIGDAAKYAKEKMATFASDLKIANEVLDTANEKFQNFKTSVKDAITGILSFGDAQNKSSDSFTRAKEAQEDLAKAQSDYDKALKTDNIEAQQTALENLQAAQTAATDSITKKKSFVQVLQDQADLASQFAGKVQTLISMGLSPGAITNVLSAGAEAGSAIADEVIAGGATVVDKVNTLTASFESVAETVGEASAATFYQAGITAGQSLVDGVKAAIAAAGFSVSAEGSIVNQAGIDQVNAAISAARGKKSSKGKKITDKERKSIMDLAASLGVEVPAFAKGGIVTGPTLALIGEAGPEAVVPLSGRNAGMGNTINLTVNAGMGADGASIGRDIVDAIKRYERTSGPVFASA
jgi:hypothetical protein